MDIKQIVHEIVEKKSAEIKEASISAKKKTVNGVVNAFTKGTSGYNAIKTMAVFTAENPDSTSQPNNVNAKLNSNLYKDLKKGGYVTFRVNGHFGNVEHPYLVINISAEAAAYYCGKYQQTSFVFHTLINGQLHSEYWEKKDETAPYNPKTNPYVKKDESDEWVNEKDADDYYTIIGDSFKYSIPFSIFNEVNESINESLDRIISEKLDEGVETSKDKLLDFTINKVGQTPALYRKAIYRNLLN